MALPGDVTTFTLTFGPYTDASGAVVTTKNSKGDPLTAKLHAIDLATGRRLNVTDVATGQVVVPKDLTVTIGSDGTGSIGPLPHTDNPGLSTVGFGYYVEWDIASGSHSYTPGNKRFAVPAASGATVDFDLLDVAAAVPGVLVPMGVSAGVADAAVSALLPGPSLTQAAMDGRYVRDTELPAELAAKQDVATLGAVVVADATVREAFIPRAAKVSDLATPIVIAHQGGVNLAPAETMEAYRAAVGYGAQVLDGDANILADGALGLMHDGTLDAATTSTGPVTAQTALSWQNLVVDAGSWFGGGFGNLKAPLVTQFLAEFGNRAVVSLEAKNKGPCAVALAREIDRFGVAQSTMASTSFIEDVPTLAATGAHVQFVMTTAVEQTPAAIAAAGAESITCDITAPAFTSSLIAQFHAAGLMVFGHIINRHVEAAAFIAKGGDGWYSNDPIYSAGASNGYKYRLTKMPFASQTFYHGHIVGTTVVPRGVFTAPDGFGWADTTNAGARTALAGGISPVKGDPNANSYTLDFSVRIESQSDTGRFVGLFVGQDNDAGFIDNGTGVGVDGYRCIINGAGLMGCAKYTDGVQQAGGVGFQMAALTLPTTVTGQVIVSPTQIQLKRTDVAATLTMNDAQHRGGYVHMEMSGSTARFTRLEVTA